MPKRSFDEKIKSYNNKIKKLQEKENKKRRRIIVYSSDSESCEQEIETQGTYPNEELPSADAEHDEVPEGLAASQDVFHQADRVVTPTPEIEPDILEALGEFQEEIPKFGQKIHHNLARLWLPILRKGLDKEAKDKMMKEYQIPENCSLLQAPKLNPEIAATISDVTRTKDKRVESAQQQLGLGITAINRGLSLLIEDDKERVKAIKLLSDGCRLLCDLHHVETDVRKKFVTPGLDKSFLHLIQDEDRDETLFGQKLSDKIRASKAIEKQSLQIKKSAPSKAPVLALAQPSTSRPRMGNWIGPPRFTSNRGGRGAYRRMAPAGRRGHQAGARPPAQAHLQNKPRAPAPQQ